MLSNDYVLTNAIKSNIILIQTSKSIERKVIPMAEEFFDDNIYTLTDENGKDEDFVLLGSAEIEDKIYLALVPADQAEKKDVEYVILRQEKDENGEDYLVTIDDDDEFDTVADLFEDELFGEVDYDGSDE